MDVHFSGAVLPSTVSRGLDDKLMVVELKFAIIATDTKPLDGLEAEGPSFHLKIRGWNCD